MKKSGKVLVLLLLTYSGGSAQTSMGVSPQGKQGKNHMIETGLALPLGNFNETHTAGITVKYTWTKKRFGPLTVKPGSKPGFIATAGAEYYFGKKETITGYPYQYTGFVFIHAGGGLLLHTGLKTAVTMSAGPALGIYAGTSRFTIAAAVSGNYYLGERIVLGPELLFRKEAGAHPFWSAVVKAGYIF